MPLQLVGSCEPLSTERPIADERTLARVPTKMSPEVGRLAIDLIASWDVTDVLLLAWFAVRIPEKKKIFTTSILLFLNLFVRPTLIGFDLRLCNWGKCMQLSAAWSFVAVVRELCRLARHSLQHQ